MFYESQPGNQSHSLCFRFKARTSGAPAHTSGVPVFSELAEPRTDEVLWPLPSQGAYGLAAGQVTILGELVRNADPHALASLTAEEWRPVCRLKSLRNCSLTLVLGLQAQGTQPCAGSAFVQTDPPATQALVCHWVVQMQPLLPDVN